jgi:hypothetical protein
MNIVDAVWPYPLGEMHQEDVEYPKDPDDEEADVDWMVMSIGSLMPSIYLSFNDRAPYYIRYKRPPIRVGFDTHSCLLIKSSWFKEIGIRLSSIQE